MKTNHECVIVKCRDMADAINFIAKAYKLGWKWAGDNSGRSTPEQETLRILGRSDMSAGVYFHMIVRKGITKHITYSFYRHLFDRNYYRTGHTILSPERFIIEVTNDQRS